MRQPCTELGKSSWCGAHLSEAEKMGWQLVLCVPRTAQEQCLGARKGMEGCGRCCPSAFSGSQV